ncbi:LptA/OstA family protein [Aerophototrophica crusticola]
MSSPRPMNRILARTLALALLGGGIATLPLGLRPADAQPASLELGGKQPVDITAQGGFEFHDKEKVAIARGGATAVQGDVTLKARTLAAYFREAPGGANEVYRLAAEGGVEIASPDQTAYGERGVYDLDKGVAVLSGGDLKLVTKQDVVTAKDTLEYWRDQDLAVARGDAVAVRENSRVRADRLVGLMQENAEGQVELTRIDAEGNVVITTPSEVARGDRGTYDIGQKVAILTGNVKITRGRNQLNGNAAEVNLETGISRLLSNPPRAAGAAAPAPADSDRVRGLFIPERQSKPATTPPAGGQGSNQP